MFTLRRSVYNKHKMTQSQAIFACIYRCVCIQQSHILKYESRIVITPNYYAFHFLYRFVFMITYLSHACIRT